MAESDAQTLGFYGLRGGPPEAELTFLFVEPAYIGTGVGHTLWGHCLGVASSLGIARIRIESDPLAEGFYVSMGATRVGDVASRSLDGRRLPLLIYKLDPSE